MSRLFITDREINFIDSIDRELVQHVVGQQVFYYAILLPESQPHKLYQEAIKKVWAAPVAVDARVKWDSQGTASTRMGIDTKYEAEVYFHVKELKERNLVPKEGDFIEFGQVFFEIKTVNMPDIVFGQVNNKTQLKCTCIPSREGQFQAGNRSEENVDHSHQVEQNKVPARFTSLPNSKIEDSDI